MNEILQQILNELKELKEGQVRIEKNWTPFMNIQLK